MREMYREPIAAFCSEITAQSFCRDCRGWPQAKSPMV
jgi:hypothetical protein